MDDAFSGELFPVVYQRDGRVEGYLVVGFDRHYVMKNDLVVREWVYHTPEALNGLASFLYRQGDQFEKIVLETQDETLAMILADVSADTYDAFQSRFVETHAVGTGLLYRVVDLSALFEAVGPLRSNVPDVSFRLTLSDDFLPENQVDAVVAVHHGRFRMTPEQSADYRLHIDIASFSSLWMGATDIESLVRLGLADVSSSAALEALKAVFRVDAKPQCWQHF